MVNDAKRFFGLCAVLFAQAVIAEFCYSNEVNPYLYFSTKTDYDISKSGYSHHQSDSSLPSECLTEGLWYFSREGTLSSSYLYKNNDMQDQLRSLQRTILDNHRKGNGQLCSDDLAKLNGWSGFPDRDSILQVISERGRYTLYSLANHYRNVFLNQSSTFKPSNFQFYHKGTAGTKESAEHLVRGWGTKYFSEPFDTTEFLEVNLNFTQATCTSAWTVPSVSGSSEEKILKNINERITQRLGFNHSLPLSDLLRIYDACRVSVSLEPSKRAVWCIPFTVQDLKELEFIYDVFYYRRDGKGGHEDVYSACSSLQHLYDFFHALFDISIDTYPKQTSLYGRFIVSDEHAVLRLLTLLEVSRDEVAMTGSNFEILDDRTWRTTFLSPYGGHILIALLRCGSSHYVRTYVQEQPTWLPGCTSIHCPWGNVKQKILDILEECSLIDHCAASVGNPAAVSPCMILMLSVMYMELGLCWH